MSNRPTFRKGPAAPVTGRTNKYPAECERCHEKVPAEQGSLTLEDGQWVVRHHGDCLQQVITVEEPKPAPSTFKVPDGRYTVSFADGTYKTLRVQTQDADADFMPGLPLLSYLSGASNDSDYTRFGHVAEDGSVRIWKKHNDNEVLREAVKVLIGSPQAAALAYAEQSGCCARCGRTLTVPASIHAGFGPDCAGKVAW